MSAASSNQAYEIELDADWYEDFYLWLGNIVTPDDLTGYEADLWLEPSKGAGNQTVLHLATLDADGRLTIVANDIQVRVLKADINTLSAQGYSLSLRLTHPSGYEEPLVALTANVVPFGSKRS